MEESSENEGTDGEDAKSAGSKTDSVKEIKRILNSVSQDKYEVRHHEMITELRIRKILAKEKIKYPTKDSFDDRKIELTKLYTTLQRAVTEQED